MTKTDSADVDHDDDNFILIEIGDGTVLGTQDGRAIGFPKPRLEVSKIDQADTER